MAGRFPFPAPRDLFIDIDSSAAFEVFNKQIVRFRRYVRPAEVIDIRQSKSGVFGRSHIVVRVDGDPLTHQERIAYQLMLGSDPVRELLSWARALAEGPHPTMFFELPGVAHPATVWDQGE